MIQKVVIRICLNLYFVSIYTESKELLEEISGEIASANDPKICSEEGMELAEIGHNDKEHIKCFLCVKRFNTTSTLDQHLLEEHQVDDEWFESLNKYVKLSPKQTGILSSKIMFFKENPSKSLSERKLSLNFFDSICR